MSEPHSIHVALTWRTRFYLWSDKWPRPISGRHYRLLRAAMALADQSASDGGLRGKHDWWTLKQLADQMHVSRNTARDFLRWLEEYGWLTSTSQTVTAEGRRPDVRWLTIPKVEPSISVVSNGPRSKKWGAKVQELPSQGPKTGVPASNGHIQTLDQSVDTEIRSYVESPDVAKATKTNRLSHTSETSKPYKTSQQHLQDVRDKVGVR